MKHVSLGDGEDACNRVSMTLTSSSDYSMYDRQPRCFSGFRTSVRQVLLVSFCACLVDVGSRGQLLLCVEEVCEEVGEALPRQEAQASPRDDPNTPQNDPENAEQKKGEGECEEVGTAPLRQDKAQGLPRNGQDRHQDGSGCSRAEINVEGSATGYGSGWLTTGKGRSGEGVRGGGWEEGSGTSSP